MFNFSSTTQIIQTGDFAEEIIRICSEEKYASVGIVIDRFLVNSVRINKLVEELQRIGSICRIYVAPLGEPTTEIVDQATEIFRGSPPQVIIGIGGGSTMDLAKSISVMVFVDAPVTDYHGTGKSILRATRKIMVPTTAGTGSEVTPGAVLVNKETSFKRALSGRLVCPDFAVLDASLTLSLPESVTITTSMDAIAHAVESYTARCSNTVTRMYSAKAFELLVNNLPRVLKNPDILEYRQRVLLGSCLAGYAIFNSNTGAAHAMAYPMGIYHDVPHGVAITSIIAQVVNKNIEKGCFIYADLLDLIESVNKTGDLKCRAERFGEYITSFEAMQKIAVDLNKYGINGSNVGHLAERALDLASALNNNPVVFHKVDVLNILKGLIRDK